MNNTSNHTEGSERQPRSGWLHRLVRHFGIVFCDGGFSVWAPLYRSINEPGNFGWERWELIFFTIRLAKLSPRGSLWNERTFYRYKYDGRPRWKLWLSSRRFISWGRDYVDLSNSQSAT